MTELTKEQIQEFKIKVKKVLRTINREDKTNALVSWYIVNRCYMTTEEFREILEVK